jgi:acyl-CoA synthetase (NDP forming)
MKNEATSDLNLVFSPRNVAVIGASPTDFYTLALMMGKLKDRLYLVNPNYTEIHGRKAYASILDIEELVDYVVLALPAKFVLDVVRDCIKKNVKVVHSFTSGFGETGLKEGIERENKLSSLIRGKLRFLGPNCMGTYCPSSGLSFNPLATHEEGHIGVISQSGTFAQVFIAAEGSRNVKISKMVSYGNAVDLDCPEFLRFLADDPDTKVIALYVEGVKDGRPLRSALEYASSKKPVIALKGGMTGQGGRVASSHTGALAGTGQTWSTLFKQTGVVQVDDFDDLLNVTIAMNESAPPHGKGVSIVTYSGGFSVVQSDTCAKTGLDVPAFSPKAVEELRKFIPSSGTMIGNPLDAWQIFYKYEDSEGTLVDVLRIVSGEKDIHSIIVQYDVVRFMILRWGKEFEGRFEKVARKLFEGLHYARDKGGKLVLMSMLVDPYSDNEIERKYLLEFKKRCESEGFSVYPSLKDAAKVVANMYRYTEMRHRGCERGIIR